MYIVVLFINILVSLALANNQKVISIPNSNYNGSFLLESSSQTFYLEFLYKNTSRANFYLVTVSLKGNSSSNQGGHLLAYNKEVPPNLYKQGDSDRITADIVDVQSYLARRNSTYIVIQKSTVLNQKEYVALYHFNSISSTPTYDYFIQEFTKQPCTNCGLHGTCQSNGKCSCMLTYLGDQCTIPLEPIEEVVSKKGLGKEQPDYYSVEINQDSNDDLDVTIQRQGEGTLTAFFKVEGNGLSSFPTLQDNDAFYTVEYDTTISVDIAHLGISSLLGRYNVPIFRRRKRLLIGMQSDTKSLDYTIILSQGYGSQQGVDLYILIIVFVGIIIIIFALGIIFVLRHNKRKESSQIKDTQEIEQLMNKCMPVLNYDQVESDVSLIECSICMVQYQMDHTFRRTTCKHIFHAKCIEDWFKQSQTCPICRSTQNPEEWRKYCEPQMTPPKPIVEIMQLDNPLQEEAKLNQDENDQMNRRSSH